MTIRNDFADPALLDGLDRDRLAGRRRHHATCATRGATVRRKADASPVTDADEAAEAIILEGARAGAARRRRWCRRKRSRNRTRRGAGHFHPGRSARRHARIHRRPRRVHRQYRDRSPEPPGRRRGQRAGARDHLARRAWQRGRAVCGCPAVRIRRTRQRAACCAPQRIAAARWPGLGERWSAARILDPATEQWLDRFPAVERIDCGSSLKFCRIAEGLADVYPRLAPTSEWDIAAGDAVLCAAGRCRADAGR